MRRTLAALALALALPGPTLLPTPARAQAVVVVREGDTLSDIAARHGISVSRLMQANGISDPDLVVVGQRLTIPGGGSRGGGGSAGSGGSVTVQAGDTLSDIAARHGISVSRLMQANGISDPDLVVAGQRLIIPGSGGRGPAPAARSTQPTAPYTVKSGETLSDIATRFNTSTDRLIQLNGLRNPDLVMSGTRLQVPVSPRPQTSRPAGATAPPAAPDRNARQHVVQSGESLSVIAERYGTTVERLVALNRIEDPDRLLSGTRLQLRGTPPAAAPRPAPSPQAAKPQASAQPAPQQVAQPAPRPAPAPAQQPQAQPQPQVQAQVQAQSRSESTPAAGSRPAAAAPTPQSAPTAGRTEPAPASTTTTSPVRAGATAATAGTPSRSNTASTATAAKATVAAPAASAGSTAAAPTASPEARTRPQAQARLQPAAVQTTSVRSPAGSASRIAAATGGLTPTQPGAVPSATSSAATPRGSTPAKSPAQAAAAGPAAIAARSTTRAPSSGGDWRSYGPLQIDWANWQSMGGSYVAPSLNSDGKARYLAVNCTARKLNTTTPAGQWNSWETPGQDFEKKLVQDICKEKGS
ncbi:LysM peptidoglycan-binding domain-containing protein [Cyanobium sp. CH-040]|uniref:LysM peptidoglycan-binding domain-containing protein n=1 Tax=Cyanobium sp. CH-040 TaxID=2823708 RepID=UPI0020CF1BFC|nr:LysM peptidoglycan-binding domain-containing protein [Cyanobium sp. CH-040]MCP9926263.1 LysM peptidoglycan-binding domain-containing protein [Cyanobium sp. CH-040]